MTEEFSEYVPLFYAPSPSMASLSMLQMKFSLLKL